MTDWISVTGQALDLLINDAGMTMRAAARQLGVEPTGLSVRLRPLLKALAVSGSAGDCACGRPRFHSGWCRNGMGVSRTRKAAAEEIKRALLGGAHWADIMTDQRVSYWAVRHVQRTLSAGERRSRLHVSPARRSRSPVPAPVPVRDALYQRIKAAIPAGIDRALRDDIISEVYLAVLDGTLQPDAIEAQRHRFINAGFAAWASKFGPRSIDEPLNDDGFTIADTLADPAALAVFDSIEFERMTA